MGMNKYRNPHVIRFLPVERRPCEEIPRGSVLGKVTCPSFEEPIGWLVKTSVDMPDGRTLPQKQSETWHFLPTCGIEPILKDFKDQGALQNAVRQQYRGIYDRKPFKRLRQIAKGDDCEISSIVLQWCGLDDFWDDHQLCADYSFISDVLPDCKSVVYRSREWEGGGPGQSGYWYHVQTENPALLIREARKITEALLAKKLAKPPPPPKRPRASKAEKFTQKEGY